jgi:hypothetical protein
MLGAVAGLSLGVLGYAGGLARSRARFPTLAMTVAVACVSTLIVELDRPFGRLFHVSQHAMLDVREMMDGHAGQVFEFMGLDRQQVVCAPKDPRKHHMIGNKMLQSFDGTVRRDRTWETVLPITEQVAVAKQLGGLLEAFGYADAASTPGRTTPQA